MRTEDILTESRQIWGPGHVGLLGIIVRLGKVFGDICRYARDELPTDAPNEAELKKEMGNLIVSGVKWCDDLGFDPEECIEIALEAQRAYVRKMR
ncbi:MAG TPA: hypothetical protein VN455_06595 [Methanotrichaceae archaeon]|nr:hypothetical protein [Methanotrichaceae archaeon]